jgi:hypothetical protein
VTAAMLLMACSSESYPGLTYENPDEVVNGETPDNEDTGKTPVRVFVNEQSFFSISAGSAASRESGDMTRGVGAFQLEDDDDVAQKLAKGQLTQEDIDRINQKFKHTHFYILAFRDKAWTQQGVNPLDRVTLPPDFRYSQLAENMPSESLGDPQRQDCLVDGYKYEQGLKATLEGNYEDVTGAFKLETKPKGNGDYEKLFYGDHGNIGYNFFAYSMGDLHHDAEKDEDMDYNLLAKDIDWGTPERTDDHISYKNFVVDGSQDLMAGYAPPLETALNTRYKNVDLTESERSTLINIGSYCTFAAHRGIDPVVNLKHLLARIQFRALPGDESASNTTIDAIYVRTHNKGELIVAHRDSSKVGFFPDETMMGDIYLHDKPEVIYDTTDPTKAVGIKPSVVHDTSIYTPEAGNVDELTDDMIWRVEWKDEYWDKDADGNNIGKKPLDQRGTPVSMGDNMMVPPRGELDIFIKSTYKLGEPDQRRFTSHYTISAANLVETSPGREKYYLDEEYFKTTGEKKYIFRPGYFYTVTLVVYGLSQIKVLANIEGWKEGDQDINVGADEDEVDMEFDDE